MEVKIIQAFPDTIAQNESEVKSWLNRGLVKGTTDDVEELFVKSLRTEVQVFCVVDETDDSIVGVVATEIIDYPRHSELVVISFAVQDFEAVKNAIDETLTEVAVSEGCSLITSLSRRGMVKALKNLGYDETFVLMQKRVGMIH